MTKAEQQAVANDYIDNINRIQKKKIRATKIRWVFSLLHVISFIGLCWLGLGAVGVTIMLGLDKQISPVFILIDIICVGIPLGLVILFTKLKNLPVSYEKKENKLKQELYNHRIRYFQETFNLTQAQLEYDLTGILNAHISFRDSWWLTNESSDVIENALNQKYKRAANEEAKADLHIENLKLQNESLEIDNIQKKFWVCSFCGNTNRGDDMSCIKCGGTRP